MEIFQINQHGFLTRTPPITLKVTVVHIFNYIENPLGLTIGLTSEVTTFREQKMIPFKVEGLVVKE